ncbi:hypothetical protein E2C11_23255 [Streptomyces lavendulae]|nr:hypothetical protein [Streptomyces lavendulae]TXJ75433.1 hypothetical protein E2C11_23255 [Streptomyces lavendulae]
MTRQTFQTLDGTDGWFDMDRATHVLEEETRWDGQNYRGVISGLQTSRADLYITAGGRWIEHHDARREFSGPNLWTELTTDQARDWMIKCGSDEAEAALAKYLPDTPDESPSPGGRPEVGPKVETRLARKDLARVDDRAAAEGVSRAEMLRRLILASLDAV